MSLINKEYDIIFETHFVEAPRQLVSNKPGLSY